MQGNKKIGFILAVFGVCFALCAKAYAYTSPICVLKSSGATFTSPNTERPCTNNINAGGDPVNTKVEFDSGCTGGTYDLDVVFEHGSRVQPFDRLGSFQGSIIFDDTKLITPTCTPDPENYFYEAIGAAMECPGSFQGQEYIWFGAHANDNVDPAKDLWPTSNPNFRLIKISFASLGFTEGQTTTMTFYDSLHTPQGNGARSTKVKTHFPGNVNDAELPDVIISCSTPPIFVNAPTNGSAVQGSVVGSCTPTTGTRNVTISFTNPTQCTENGVTKACPATCTPGTKVVRTGPSAATISAGTTSTSVTDTCTIDGNTTPYVYTLTGVCTGTGGAAESTTSTTAQLAKCQCGEPPVLSSVKINGTAYTENITAGGGFSFLQGSAIKFTGTVTDNDSAYSDITVTLYYQSDGDRVPVTATVASDKTFTVEIPGSAVSADFDIYWGMTVQDELGLKGTPIPADLEDPVADITDDGFISKDTVSVGTKLDFVRMPSANQYPFRAGGQTLIIDFALNESANITTRIYTADGTLVRQIDSSTLDPEASANVCCSSCRENPSGSGGCSWDGTNYLGGNNFVGNGLYIVNISAFGTGQNFSGQSLSYTKGIVVMK